VTNFKTAEVLAMQPENSDFIHSLPVPSLASLSRAAVLEYFRNSWELTECLFSCLRGEEAFLRPPHHGLRHPMIFYYGHSAVFYINKLQLASALGSALNREFESYFAVGVDENSWDDLSKNEKEWPSLTALKDYRARAFATIEKFIQTTDLLEPGQSFLQVADGRSASPLRALFMAIEHERVHLETSAVLIRELPLHLVSRPPRFAPLHPSAHLTSVVKSSPDLPEIRWISVQGGEVTLGRPASWPTFGWDNEYGLKTEKVDEFQVSASLISNSDFLCFIESGGYGDQSLWSADGWAWRVGRDISRPPFWVQGLNSSYRLRTLFEEIEMPWDWPAVVNFHEAKAYALWRAKQDQHPMSLLSEAEHHRLRAQANHFPPTLDYGGWYGAQKKSNPLYQEANFELRWSSESPVTPAAPGRCNDVFGNVWQWIENAFYALPGFQIDPLYPDYSAPSFDGHHQMIMGGSYLSSGTQATPWIRSHFRPHFHQAAGFRLRRGKQNG
jgi:5-histidylcysteine sulfoxide synthase